MVATEENERRRLAEALHHDALQNLLVARQDLAEMTQRPNTRRATAAVEATIDQLREAIRELHPVVSVHQGFEVALRAAAESQGDRSGFRAHVSIAPDAIGVNDSLLLSLAREQIVNAAKHASASEVTIDIACTNGTILMDVTDDGRGMDEADRRAALDKGHIGLASSRERVEALGGKLEIDSSRGLGTRIRTTIPVSTGKGH